MTDKMVPGAGYTATARVLHWITAVLVLGMIVVGFIIANEWGGAWQERLYNLHKSTGAVLIPIAAMSHHFVRRDRVLVRMITG